MMGTGNQDDQQEHADDPLHLDADSPLRPHRSELLDYLASLPEPTDTAAPDPTVEELLDEAEFPGGSDRIAADARRRDPGPLTAQMLAVIHPTRLGPKGLLDAACAAERLASWTQATQHRYLSAFARPGVAAPMRPLVDYASAPGQPLHQTARGSSAADATDPDLASSGTQVHGRPAQEKAALTATAVKVAAAEVSAAMLVSPISANRRVAQAVDFTDDLPATLTALRDGVIDRGRAMVIADRTQNLPTDLRRRVEARIVPKAAGRTAGQLRGIADRAVIAADPAAAQKRQEAARIRRGISIRPGEDGMSVFRADLTADKSVTAFTVIDQIAMATARDAAEKRSIGALRADVFADIFDQLANHGSVHLFTPTRAGAPGQPCSHQQRATPPIRVGSPVPDAESVTTTATAPPDTTTPATEPTARVEFVHPTGVSGDPNPVNPDTAVPVPDTVDGSAGPDRITGDTGTADSAGTNRSGVPGTSVTQQVSTEQSPFRRPVAGTSDAAVPCDCHRSGGSSTAEFWGLGTHQGRTTGLCVTIAATTLAGLDDLPGELDGHGPIPADMARALAASAATITAVAVNPACGTALDLGRTTYRPRLAQRDRVVQRDRTCRFVGCRQPAWRCQIDHSDEYCPGQSDGGVTCPCNLACVCKFHHDLKTFGLWDTIHHPDDSITWISPHQRRYTSQPREWLTGLASDTTDQLTGPANNGQRDHTDVTVDGAAPTQPDEPPPF
jgi:hypothetical protein